MRLFPRRQTNGYSQIVGPLYSLYDARDENLQTYNFEVRIMEVNDEKDDKRKPASETRSDILPTGPECSLKGFRRIEVKVAPKIFAVREEPIS